MRRCLGWLCCLLLWQGMALADRVPLSARYGVGDRYMEVRLIGTVRLDRRDIDGVDLSELSGLAWDADEGLFYAVSDEGGLFHLRPEFEKGRLVGVHAVAGYPLRGHKGRPLRSEKRDAEGLALVKADNGIRGDTELMVSFEVWPRLRRYAPTGQWLGKVKLPRALKGRKHYDSLNHALETVAVHPRYGILTAPERPMKGAPQAQVRVYESTGEGWAFHRAPHPKASMVGMDVLSDGSLLVLERAYSSMLEPLVVYVRRVWLTPECRIAAGGLCHTQLLARFSSGEGWLLDNFEGLTRYGQDAFCMVSDDGRHWFQRTLLSCFRLEVRPTAPPTPADPR